MNLKKRFNSFQRNKKQSAVYLFVFIVVSCMLLFLITSFPQIIKQTQQVVPPISFAEEISTGQEQSDNKISMIFAGDVMMDRTVGSTIEQGGNPFENVKDKFNEHDIVILNLETVVSDRAYAAQALGKLYTFNSPTSAIDVLKANNVSVVSLANNHSMDYGANALINTMDNLQAKGILHVGAGKTVNEAFAPRYLLFKNTKIAFLAFNDIENWFTDVSDYNAGSAYFDEGRIRSAVSEAKSNADIVIVMPHWGIEYSLNNSERQNYFGRLFVDSGADIVIGAHPHVIQNSEEYNGKMIYYSLGNFVFDGMCSIANACDAAMVQVFIEDKKILTSNILEVRIDDRGYPSLK